MDKNDATGLKNPEAVLNALRAVKVCDPVCGSGAYLLGMLHELLEQRECLFAARSLDAKTVYDRKLETIQNNLYGADKDDFAVNIACLRLWLSLKANSRPERENQKMGAPCQQSSRERRLTAPYSIYYIFSNISIALFTLSSTFFFPTISMLSNSGGLTD